MAEQEAGESNTSMEEDVFASQEAELAKREDEERKAFETEGKSIFELFGPGEVKKLVSRHRRAGLVKRSSSLLTKGLPTLYNLQFSFIHFACGIREDVDLVFQIFDAISETYTSEPYTVRLTKHGVARDADKEDKMNCIFTELAYEGPILQDLYLTCSVFRYGALRDKELKPDDDVYRRPLAGGVMSVRSFVDTEEASEEDDVELKIDLFEASHEDDFANLHKFLVKNQTNKFSALANTTAVHFALRLIQGSLNHLRTSKADLLHEKKALARRIGSSEVNKAGVVRNDLYLTLVSAEFEKDGRITPRNIEVAVIVCLEDGLVLRDCIIPSAGEHPIVEHRSYVLYHCNSPRWMERIKIDIPVDKFQFAHLKLYFRHCSSHEDKDKKEPIGFAFLPFMSRSGDGLTIADGDHTLTLYKYDSELDGNGAQYLTSQRLEPLAHDTCIVNTLLCSTKMTHNPSVLCLLHWRSHKGELEETLANFPARVTTEEVVMFLTDILDAIFAVLNSLPQHAPHVFRVLVYIIDLLAEKRVHNTRPVLDAYITQHFHNDTAHESLLLCLEETLRHATDPSGVMEIRAVLKSFEYIFKFAVQSRIVQRRHLPDSSDSAFKADISEAFDELNKLLRRRHHPEGIVGTQVIALQHTAAVFEELADIYEPDELGALANSFLLSLNESSEDNSLCFHKLSLMRGMAEGPIFRTHESREAVLGTYMHVLEDSFLKRVELHTALDVLSAILTALEHDSIEMRVMDVDIIIKHLLGPLLALVRDIQDFERTSRSIVANFLCLLRILHPENLYNYAQSFSDEKERVSALTDLLKVISKVMKDSVFPVDWIALYFAQNEAILNAGKCFTVLLCEEFANEFNFDSELFSAFFDIALSQLGKEPPSMDDLTKRVQDELENKFLVLRKDMGTCMGEVWAALHESQRASLTEALVVPVVELTLQPEAWLKELVLSLFSDVVRAESTSKGCLRRTESLLAEGLGKLMYEGRSNEEHSRMLMSILEEQGSALGALDTEDGKESSAIEKSAEESKQQDATESVTNGFDHGSGYTNGHTPHQNGHHHVGGLVEAAEGNAAALAAAIAAASLDMAGPLANGELNGHGVKHVLHHDNEQVSSLHPLLQPESLRDHGDEGEGAMMEEKGVTRTCKFVLGGEDEESESSDGSAERQPEPQNSQHSSNHQPFPENENDRYDGHNEEESVFMRKEREEMLRQFYNESFV